ncbi:CD59 glycoprotein-like [Daphnia carinata]|uniref:CD59 glycoprotein-like n=1 Tax=Daphnia carinata TaxID=120202 RepID=UPI00257CA21B|nr:CD59 glycoprotein-like [Daphnia carinata]
MNVRSVLGGLLLLSLASRGQSIKCYECTSNPMAMNSDCETGVHRSKPQTCPLTTKFCDYVKIKIDAGIAFNMIYRGCGEDSTWIPNNVGFEDKKLGIATVSYRSCNKDLCNGDVWDKSLYNNSKDSHSCDASLLLLAILTSLCLILSF